MTLRYIWQCLTAAILLFGAVFPVFAETVELVTYYPSSSGADDLHVRSLTVGNDYKTVDMTSNDGVALVSKRLGVGTAAPAMLGSGSTASPLMQVDGGSAFGYLGLSTGSAPTAGVLTPTGIVEFGSRNVGVGDGRSAAIGSYLDSTSKGQMIFSVGNATATLQPQMWITPTGVGINNDSPDNKLSVAGAISVKGARTANNVASSTVIENVAGAAHLIAMGPNNATRGTFIIRQDSSDRTSTRDSFAIDAGGRVGIGTNFPETSALLQLVSNNRGFLLPGMGTGPRDNDIRNPADGLLIYNTETKSFDYWDATAPGVWRSLSGTGGGSEGTVSRVEKVTITAGVTPTIEPSLRTGARIQSVVLLWMGDDSTVETQDLFTIERLFYARHNITILRGGTKFRINFFRTNGASYTTLNGTYYLYYSVSYA